MKFKVLLDTNILIAASTYMFSKELSIDLKHKFFDQAMSLIGFLRKHLAKRLGIVTSTIETEAYFNLEQAVRTELEEQVTDRVTDFQAFSVILNSCENRLRDILSYLLREPVDPLEVSKNYVKVANMYNELTEKANAFPTPKEYAALMTSAAPKGFKRVSFEAYKTVAEFRNAQLTNLLLNPVEDSDKTILAEAVHLLNLYKQTQGKDVTFVIASMDHHFSPIRRQKFESRVVTDRIYDLFGILCDWPYEVEQLLRSEIK